MYNSPLGSSFGGCYSPKDYKVSNPTFGGSTTFANASGSRQGGYYYSPLTNERKNFPARDLLGR
jgi:hypothetical protein